MSCKVCKRRFEDDGDDSGSEVVSNTMEPNIKRQRRLADVFDSDDDGDSEDYGDSGYNGDSEDNGNSGLEVESPNTVELNIECDDPFHSKMLPELVVKIFSYLGYKDLLLTAALVCKRWEAFSRVPQLWNKINLQNRSDVTTETVEKLVKRSKGIKFINLSGCRLIEDSVISEIAKLEMLQTLILASCEQLSPRTICSIANCRTLKHLDLSDLSLNDDALGMIAKSCTNLVCLDVRACIDITTQGLLPVIQHCVQLNDLRFSYCVKVDDEFLIALAEKPFQIESLYIAGCNFTEEGLKYLRKLPKLTSIDVGAIDSMCDRLVSTFSNLTFLNLKDLEDITDGGISAIVRNNPNLKTFILSRCKSINDNDISEETIYKWQIEYPNVEFNF